MEARVPNSGDILLVDDSANDIELTLSALEGHGFDKGVVVLRDGAEALDYLFKRGQFANRKGTNPIVILLDNKMPRVSGLDVLKKIKTDEHLKSIPVVALTSSCEAPDLVDFYKHGVNAYVVKPVNLEDFIKAVGQLGVFWAAVNEPPLKR